MPKDLEKQLNRRKFLKGAVVAVPGVAAANAAEGRSQTSRTALPKWDREVDVVIVGSGFAGLAAAITAKDAGAQVLVLEKMEQKFEAGNSRVSGNMWWAPTNLPEAVQYMEALCQGLTDTDNHQIPRLYSAGESGSFWGWMYNGGGNNAEALCTGRIAGRNVIELK